MLSMEKLSMLINKNELVGLLLIDTEFMWTIKPLVLYGLDMFF